MFVCLCESKKRTKSKLRKEYSVDIEDERGANEENITRKEPSKVNNNTAFAQRGTVVGQRNQNVYENARLSGVFERELQLKRKEDIRQENDVYVDAYLSKVYDVNLRKTNESSLLSVPVVNSSDTCVETSVLPASESMRSLNLDDVDLDEVYEVMGKPDPDLRKPLALNVDKETIYANACISEKIDQEAKISEYLAELNRNEVVYENSAIMKSCKDMIKNPENYNNGKDVCMQITEVTPDVESNELNDQDILVNSVSLSMAFDVYPEETVTNDDEIEIIENVLFDKGIEVGNCIFNDIDIDQRNSRHSGIFLNIGVQKAYEDLEAILSRFV